MLDLIVIAAYFVVKKKAPVFEELLVIVFGVLMLINMFLISVAGIRAAADTARFLFDILVIVSIESMFSIFFLKSEKTDER